MDHLYGAAHPEHYVAPPMPNAKECTALIAEIEAEEKRLETEYIRLIAALPASREKRVIAFGLYGDKPKYVHGALANIKLARIFYPGWVCRFYVFDVPTATVVEIKAAGGEVVPGTKDMLSRFQVAFDEAVDRFLVRDIDSRLNARERWAVEQWVQSGLAIHSMRDHLNQQYEYNGGMWGGTKGSMPLLLSHIQAIPQAKRADGMIDIETLGKVWAFYKNATMAHDSHHCGRYRRQGHAHTLAFPTRRPLNYLHVGQVHNDNDHPRIKDVDLFLRGKQVPAECRAKSDWIMG